jgi:hypothetical protein
MFTNSRPVPAAPKTETRSASATGSPPMTSNIVESPETIVVHPRVDRQYFESTEERPKSPEGSILQPPQRGVTNSDPVLADPKTETRSAPATTSPPPLSSTAGQSPSPVGPSVIENNPGDLHLSDAETAVLVQRGDAFLSLGDITSARLFYERAANAGSGPAALRLGATFDPAILGHASARGVIADPAQALSWYKRARNLGMVEAEQPIKRSETPSLGQRDTRSP